jgi:hypothetical protein
VRSVLETLRHLLGAGAGPKARLQPDRWDYYGIDGR